MQNRTGKNIYRVIKKGITGIRRKIGRFRFNSIQTAITILFSLVSIISMLVLTMVLYANFYRQNGRSLETSTQLMMGQIGQNLESFLGNAREVSDAAYYDAIQESVSSGQDLNDKFGLLCEANKDNIESIALYDLDGSLLEAFPVMSQKSDPDVTNQEWFREAVGQIENVHISLPHVQNLFYDTEAGYRWVVSLSRVVEINDGETSRQGVLLVDLDYNVITTIMEDINDTENGQYFYLCDSGGNMIYHPEMMRLNRNLMRENSAKDVARDDGVYEETFQGKQRTAIVQTISYTGWKLVGVIPPSGREYGMTSMTLNMIAIFLISMMILLALNRILSSRISNPLRKLNASVKDYEAGQSPDIYCGGTEEIQHLGRSIQKSYEQIERLMKQIILEQNERRKSEIDALQSQIHPHFLYNTLDSITWMIEGGREDEAVQMISDLARLLRVSLSRGRTIISIEDEMQHAESYMAIQKVRYQERFLCEFQIDPSVMNYCTVKLIVQPVLENAIYYGVGNMDEDEGGKITVIGKQKNGNIILTVSDNGQGMPEDVVDRLLTDTEQVHKHGNGVGLVNVNRRIRLIFGNQYGLSVQSEPDRGTSVAITFPAVIYTKENAKDLENGLWREDAPEEKS